MWRLYAILSALFAALTSIFAKVGLQDINSDLATAIRTTIILLLTWGIVFFGHKADGITNLTWQTWLFLILSGISTGLSWLFYFKALQTGDVSRVAPIDKLSIVITILLAFIFLHEKITLRVLIGSLLISGGVLLML
ncbi:MAG: EamA family transporter [Bacteroidales bacterium]|nr:EamA family transporter [Bacteroidales bacterium]